VDTCGAGDGYAAGFMYGFLTGLDPTSMGRFGARVASTVIAKHGGALSTAEAELLVDKTAVMHPQESSLDPATFFT
jgi:sugar/nucleoside kinase (ribokinase family)